MFIDNNGQVLTRMQIIDYVWKDSEETPYDRVIDVYIKELRKKLQLDCITTIRNVGYKLERKWKIKDISKNVHTNIFCSWNNNYISSFINFLSFLKHIWRREKKRFIIWQMKFLVIWMEKK